MTRHFIARFAKVSILQYQVLTCLYHFDIWLRCLSNVRVIRQLHTDPLPSVFLRSYHKMALKLSPILCTLSGWWFPDFNSFCAELKIFRLIWLYVLLVTLSCNTFRLEQNDWHFAFSNAFSWLKIFLIWFQFYWSLLLSVQLTMFQH